MLPAGSNMSVSWEGARPPVILAGASKVQPTQQVKPTVVLGREHLFRRLEFNFLDFQFNQTAPLATSLVQNLEIYANITLWVWKVWISRIELHDYRPFKLLTFTNDSLVGHTVESLQPRKSPTKKAAVSVSV